MTLAGPPPSIPSAGRQRSPSGGFVGFVIGPYIDRYGARPLMLMGACVYAVAFLGMSRIETLWQFIVLSHGR